MCNYVLQMLDFAAILGRIRASGLRVIIFFGNHAEGYTLLRQAEQYCELQYKCRILFQFSIENAEIMWNFPWKMMILC